MMQQQQQQQQQVEIDIGIAGWSLAVLTGQSGDSNGTSTTMVCPKLEFASTAWDPHKQKDAQLL